MKVQTDVKAGGGLLGGLLNITAIVIVDVDVNLWGGGCCYNRCGGC